MDTHADTDETLQPEPRELSGESLLTTDYLGVRAHTPRFHTPPSTDTLASLSRAAAAYTQLHGPEVKPCLLG